MSGEPMSDNDRWEAFADELELTPEERREFVESMEQMRRGEGRTITSEELRGESDEDQAS